MYSSVFTFLENKGILEQTDGRNSLLGDITSDPPHILSE